jgi:hypothetical protein
MLNVQPRDDPEIFPLINTDKLHEAELHAEADKDPVLAMGEVVARMRYLSITIPFSITRDMAQAIS